MSLAHIHDDYQAFTRTTAVYPAPQAAEYLALALCEEVGETAEAFHPFLPFRYEGVSHKVGPSVLAELGDVLWYSARIADEMGVKLSSVMNVEYDGEASIPAAMFRMVVAAARIAGRRKKVIRDGQTWSHEKRAEVAAVILNELGMVIACVRVVARFFDSSLEGVMHANRVKLSSRKERGAIHGDGSTR